MSDRNQKWGDVIKRMAKVASTINKPGSTSAASADEPTKEDYAIQGPFARPLWASLHPEVPPQASAAGGRRAADLWRHDNLRRCSRSPYRVCPERWSQRAALRWRLLMGRNRAAADRPSAISRR